LAITVYSPIKDKSSPVKLFINLTPSIPLSLKGEGEEYTREASPLFDSLLVPANLEERGKRF